MSIEEYIQSGIIESYVLGLADKDEIADVENMRKQHPQVQAAITAFEDELEATSMQHAITPPAHVKDDIFNDLSIKPAPAEASQTTKSQVHHITPRKTYKWLAAACLLLLILSAALNFYTYSRYKNAIAQNRQLALQREQLFADNKKIQTRMLELDDNMKAITGTDIIKVQMAGVPGKEGNEAIVYWSKSSKDVYIVAKNLPKAPAGKQYQLWALADGKPIDAGMLGDCTSVCKLKNIHAAQAFAITLEKEGGSPTPTLEEMYVMGKIS